MFRKTIQNIQTTRTNVGGVNYPNEVSTGYNTERYERFPPQQQDDGRNSQRKTLTSGQFSQLKKASENKPSQLIIRECDVNEYSTQYKKPSSTTPRQQAQQINNVYQFANNSSNKKQRIGIGSRKTFDSAYKQPLDEIHYSDRDNIPKSSDRNSITYDLPSNNSSSLYEIQLQMQNLKQYIFQTHQQHASDIKKTKLQAKNIQIECMGELENFANQISKELNGQKEDIINANKRGVENQRDLRHFKDGFNAFVKDNEEKIESLVLDINNAGIGSKKSRGNADEFGVDLKSSSHCISGGVGTSMSINFRDQTVNLNLKLYNQMSAQLQVLKSELQQCKQKIQHLQKDTKTIQLERKNSKQQPQREIIKQRVDLKEVEKMIIEKFSQEKRKNQFNQKINDLDLKTKDLYKVYQDMDANIKGMNAEFTRVINGTVIKKEKMLEAKLALTEEKINELFEKISPIQMQETIKSQVKKTLEEKSQKTKIIKIRQPSQHEKMKLQSIKSAQITYMLDQEGYLLDSSGHYIIQYLQSSSVKQKIKIQKEILYLLQSQGIQIKTI